MPWDSSSLFSLATADAQRVEQACPLFHLLWTAPIAVIIAVGLLSLNLGPSALAGFGFLLITIPVLALASRRLSVLRKQTNLLTASRVSLTREVLQALRGIRLLGYEQAFIGRLSKQRMDETALIQKAMILKNVINAASMVTITTRLAKHRLIYSELTFTGFGSLIHRIRRSWRKAGSCKGLLFSGTLQFPEDTPPAAPCCSCTSFRWKNIVSTSRIIPFAVRYNTITPH